jgi:uncharacterized protein YjbI with pentapeptide repeats
MRWTSPKCAWAGRRCPEFLILTLLILGGLATNTRAECQVLVTESSAGVLSKRLSVECTDLDREAEAVTSDQVLEALAQGRGVDLEGVLITGDLHLDALPILPVEKLGAQASRVRGAVGEKALEPLRIVAGSLSIRDSHVRGEIATKIVRGYVVMAGRVTMTGTTFERAVDFSHSVFLQPVDFGNAELRKEAYFIQARFLEGAEFTEASFGSRARFHKAHFLNTAGFTKTRFNGMAEFLELRFHKEARFSQSYFRVGTGFSGSRFGGPSNWSDAVFERGAFFLHTVFEGDADFRGATFRGLSDFSQAEFLGVEDFSTAIFDKEPRFSGAKSSGGRATPGGLQDPRLMYGAAAALLVLTVAFLWALRRRRAEP